MKTRSCMVMVTLLLIAATVNSGCWGRKFFRAPGESIETSAKVDSLLGENMILQRRIYQIEQMLAAQQDYSRSVNAQAKIDREELMDQLNALSEIIAGTGNTPLARSGGREEPTGGTHRSGEASRPGASVQDDRRSARTGSGQTDSLVSDVTPPDGGTGAAVPGADQEELPAAEAIYRQIYLDFSRMEYQIALDESETFLQRYSDDPLIEDVRYVRGECFMELGKHFDALKEFSAILQQYPGGRKTPPALLRMAISYDSIGDRDLAAGVVRRLVREYPGSGEAAAARERFSDMINE